MRQYADLIQVDESFQYSVNLQFDLNKLKYINNYIPTSAAVAVLKSYLQSVAHQNQDRATVLIGPYGKGKSHLLLVLLALLSMQEQDVNKDLNIKYIQVLERLISLIDQIDEECGQLIREITQRKRKFLPVILNGNHEDIKQAILIGIRDALEQNQLEGVLPTTYFDVALDTLQRWQESYTDTYDAFNKILVQEQLTIEKISIGLKRYDKGCYDIFSNIYPLITGGSQFNPLLDADVISLVKDLNNTLYEEHNYGGLFFVFDEFGKYIENKTQGKSALDLKILQDLAELSNRSKEKQVHLVCITHKSIGQYVSFLPKEKIDSFRTVEGRFKEVYFNTSAQQSYELIQHTLKRDQTSFETFMKEHQMQLDQVEKDILNMRLFRDVNDIKNIVLRGCYPLHPLTAFSVIRVSEKVAQNERTLFTFLSKNEKGSLARFLKSEIKKDLSFVTLESIYDYFEILFIKDVYNPEIHQIWLRADTLLKKVEDKLEEKIIKVMAIIYIVNEINQLPPTYDILRFSLNIGDSVLTKALNSLLRKHLIVKKTSNDHYAFLAGSALDIKRLINETKETKIKTINRREALTDIVNLGYIAPKKYNDEYMMTRYFKNLFVNYKQLLDTKDLDDLLTQYTADGIILYVLYSSNEGIEALLKHYESITNAVSERIILCIPEIPFDKDDELLDVLAIKHLLTDVRVKDDEMAVEELNLILADKVENVRKYIDQQFGPQNKKVNYYRNKNNFLEKEVIKKELDLNRLVSEICEEVYKHTPRINNEMVNKHSLSNIILKARNKVIEQLLDKNVDFESTYNTGYMPEATIYRATITNLGLGLTEQGRQTDEQIDLILDTIRNFILRECSEKTSLSKLYDIVCKPPYGLRKGVVPIYLAYVYRDYFDSIVIYKGKKELPLNAGTLSNVNDKPEDYSIKIEQNTQELYIYLDTLKKIFKDYEHKGMQAFDQPTFVISLMKNWIRSLPKYSREYTKVFSSTGAESISRDVIEFRKELLQYDINCRELLFEKIPNKIFMVSDLDSCINRIIEIKKQLNPHLDQVLEYLMVQIKKAINAQQEISLSGALVNWYGKLNSETKKHLFDTTTSRVLNYISTLESNDDYKIVKDLIYIVETVHAKDLNDLLLAEFIENIKLVFEKVSYYTPEEIDDSNIKKVSIAIDGQPIELTYEQREITGLGQMLANNINDIIEEFGDSIDVHEKMSIIVDVIKRLTK